jgi:hypothetical protein
MRANCGRGGSLFMRGRLVGKKNGPLAATGEGRRNNATRNCRSSGGMTPPPMMMMHNLAGSQHCARFVERLHRSRPAGGGGRNRSERS